MAKRKSKFSLVAIDTNIFIYFFDRNSQFYGTADKLIKDLISDKTNIVTTVLTLSELLSFKVSQEHLDRLEDQFLQMPRLELRDVNIGISKKAASIRRNTSLKLVDSIQLATALASKAQVFITNDDRLKVIKEIKVLTLKDL